MYITTVFSNLLRAKSSTPLLTGLDYTLPVCELTTITRSRLLYLKLVNGAKVKLRIPIDYELKIRLCNRPDLITPDEFLLIRVNMILKRNVFEFPLLKYTTLVVNALDKVFKESPDLAENERRQQILNHLLERLTHVNDPEVILKSIAVDKPTLRLYRELRKEIYKGKYRS